MEIKLINILKEVVLRPTPIFPKRLVADLDILTEYFGEGDSGFDLYDPSSEIYDLERYQDDDDEDDEESSLQAKALKNILKLPKGTYVHPDIFGGNFSCPGAPSNAFYTCIEVSDGEIQVYAPYIDNNNGNNYVGWFDNRGKYHPDTKHFDENGEAIG